MAYHNLLVQVTGHYRDEIQTAVSSAPAGQKLVGFATLDPLQTAAHRSKLAFSPSLAGLKALGARLFDALFTGDLANLVRQAQDLAHQANTALRIQLEIGPDELSVLPWELLFDRETHQFWALSRNTTLMRYLPIPQPPHPPLAASPLRILALFPNPLGMPPIDIGLQRGAMEEALQPLIHSGQVELITLEHPGVRDMVQALRERQVHVLYYQGHVGFNPSQRTSFFLLEDRTGDAFMKGMEELSYTLLGTDVRLAVINSCGMAAGTLAYELVRRGVPGAVATQEPLTVAETTVFLRGFSQALVDGLPVDAAISKGRWAMIDGRPVDAAISDRWLEMAWSAPQGHWASPILVVRETDAALFSLEGQP